VSDDQFVKGSRHGFDETTDRIETVADHSRPLTGKEQMRTAFMKATGIGTPLALKHPACPNAPNRDRPPEIPVRQSGDRDVVEGSTCMKQFSEGKNFDALTSPFWAGEAVN